MRIYVHKGMCTVFAEAQVACARKLLTVVWSVLRNDKGYEAPSELGRAASEEADSLLEDIEEE